MARKRPVYYVWFDAEYSSVDIEEASLLQVAALITDSSLRRVLPREQDVRLMVRPREATRFSPWVKQHLGDLVRACQSEQAVDVADADDRLAAYTDAAVGVRAEKEETRPLLAGNSIHFDWWLIRRFLPHFLSRLHYRHLDVSAFKIEWKHLHSKDSFDKEDPNMIRMYFPDAFLPDSGAHDAYYDVQASIAELEFYRRYFFSP